MIKDLIPGMTNINLKAEVVSMGDTRDVKTKYGKNKVCEATIEDETGEITLTLWGDQISKVEEGKTVLIKGGYTTEFKGEVKVNVPRKGVLKLAEEEA